MGEHNANNFSDIEYVFLDRDGVLNRSLPDGRFITRWEEFELLPGVAGAIAQLNRSGRKVIVVTNQRCVALGLCSVADLLTLHERLRKQLTQQGARLDAIYYCPHDVGQCNCRKPLPGLFEQAFRDFPGADATSSVMVGDSLRDIEAGARLGMRTIFIDTESESGNRSPDADRATALASAAARSLPDCVQQYLSREGTRKVQQSKSPA
jgi:D-glycero-D-manno-heptose 1,7-bisphosphate phosphatase